jgi:branched-chain amino acid transport system ATP-binding protein
VRLEVVNLTAAYGSNIAVRDVSLVVPSGSVVALLGPNGAGKTTLVSAVSGLVRAQRGAILLDDIDVTALSTDERVRRGLCHVTEGRAVYPGLTVAENLRMFAERGRERDQVERAIEAFPRLGERLKQIAGTMSGGEQQMLALARAYARGAPLVMLDEVSMGLAPKIVDEVFVFLGRLAAAGTSLLVVEQYVAKALAIADFAYLIVRGQVVFAGQSNELEGSDIFERYLGSDFAA